MSLHRYLQSLEDEAHTLLLSGTTRISTTNAVLSTIKVAPVSEPSFVCLFDCLFLFLFFKNKNK